MKYKMIRSTKVLYEALKDGKDIFYAKNRELSIFLGEECKFSADDYSQFTFIDVYERIQKGQVWVAK